MLVESQTLLDTAFNLCQTPVQKRRVGMLRQAFEYYKQSVLVYQAAMGIESTFPESEPDALLLIDQSLEVFNQAVDGESLVAQRLSGLSDTNESEWIRFHSTAVLAIAESNLVLTSTNPSFETIDGDFAEDWTKWVKINEPGTLSLSTNCVRSGSTSILCDSVERGGPVLRFDFQSDKLDREPTCDARQSNRTDAKLIVVNSASNHADPFGGEGNQSLVYMDTGGYEGKAGWATKDFVPATGKLTYSMKFYMTVDEKWNQAFAVIQAGINAEHSDWSAKETAVVLYVFKKDIGVRNGSSFKKFKDGIARNTVWNIETGIDTGTQTWTVSINGTPLVLDGVSTFGFRNPIDGINFVGFRGTTTAKDSDGTKVFFDEIKLEKASSIKSPSLLNHS